MVEVVGTFGSFEEWRSWRANVGGDGEYRNQIVGDIRTVGYIEPITKVRRFPEDISIVEENLHETITAAELNSRKRALLATIEIAFGSYGLWGRRDLRILSADGLSRMALIMRGIYPFFLGTEYLPTSDSRERYFPVQHTDLQEIGFDDCRFDAFVSGDVFEHIPDLGKALREIVRVLKPGGLIVSSFPFHPNQRSSVVKARLQADGSVIHLAPPEYHGNPVDPAQGSLVFELPGWEIVERVRTLGCDDAYFVSIASSRFGIVSNAAPGPFVLVGRKAAAERPMHGRPSNVVVMRSLPDRLCTLISLPRSGSTLLASMLAVHSKVQAVYEPWNAGSLPLDCPASIASLADAEKLGDLKGRALVVKETAAHIEHIRRIRDLHRSASHMVDAASVVLIRDPSQTYLSTVKRQREWWNSETTVGEDSFDAWCQSASVAMREMLDVSSEVDGTVVVLERLALRPEETLKRLSNRIGIEFERQQLDYQLHLDLNKVRGDRNLQTQPREISVAATQTFSKQLQQVQQMARESRWREWFDEFLAFYVRVSAAGGFVQVRSMRSFTPSSFW